MSGVSPTTGQKSGRSNRERNFGLAGFIKKRISKDCVLSDFLKRWSEASPPACKPMKPTSWKRARRGCSAYASESDSALRHSIFDSAESFDPELTTEGLVAGCGSLFTGSAGQSGKPSLLFPLSSVFWHLLSVFCPLSSGICHLSSGYLSVSAATPGRVLPSINSSEAPPPVETCDTLSATPALLTADAESPPPITVVAPFAVTWANSSAMA